MIITMMIMMKMANKKYVNQLHDNGNENVCNTFDVPLRINNDIPMATRSVP